MNYHELTITIPAPFRDTLIRRLVSIGCLGVIEQDDSFLAYFPETVDRASIRNELSIVQALLAKSGSVASFSVHSSSIPDQDWNETWKKGFVPIDVGERFTILPTWEKTKQGRINLIVDPAMAFGTGHHETTRSCLVLLEKYAGRSDKESLLDLGTGTGILAIAAKKLGFHRVAAVDTDLLAVDATRKNADLNEAEGIDIREGSIAELNETYSFILANIISGVLVLLAPEIAAHLKTGGIAVLSGILAGQDDEVLEAMTKAGLKLFERYPDGKWISLAVGR